MPDKPTREWIKLTPDQVAIMRPYVERTRTARELGEPGMLLAQFHPQDNGELWIVPCFLAHAYAKLIEQKGCTAIPGLVRGAREDRDEAHNLEHAGSNPAPATQPMTAAEALRNFTTQPYTVL